jgi:lipid II:glycine glycyltransferase (peptidoglycan interpeptide bridge formation enzyme)
MTWSAIHNRAEWDAALCQLPHPHVLQSWAWGELKSRWGWRPERWQLDDESANPRAMLQLLARRVGPAQVLYAPKGPAARDADSYSEALAFVETRAKKSLTVWAKVDGDPLFVQGRGEGLPRPYDQILGDARARLRARGWAYSPQQVQFRNTMFTILKNASDDDLLKQMKDKTRYNARLAERRALLL